jgi:hypothetical protein
MRTPEEIQKEIDAAPWPIIRLYKELEEAQKPTKNGNITWTK